MKKILIGTGNEGKRRFLADLLKELPAKFVSLRDLGISATVEETGSTPEENAIIKALGYYAAAQIPTLAIDSALSIKGLPGSQQPGVYVRRITQAEDATDEMVLDHYSALIGNLGGEAEGVWSLSIALALQTDEVITETFRRRTILCSEISPRRVAGAPLNSMQFDPESGKYLAEMDPEEMRRFYRRKAGFFEFVESHLGKIH